MWRISFGNMCRCFLLEILSQEIISYWWWVNNIVYKDRNFSASCSRYARRLSSGTEKLLWNYKWRATFQTQACSSVYSAPTMGIERCGDYMLHRKKFCFQTWCSRVLWLEESKCTSCNLPKSSRLISKTLQWSRELWQYFKEWDCN